MKYAHQITITMLCCAVIIGVVSAQQHQASERATAAKVSAAQSGQLVRTVPPDVMPPATWTASPTVTDSGQILDPRLQRFGAGPLAHLRTLRAQLVEGGKPERIGQARVTPHAHADGEVLALNEAGRDKECSLHTLSAVLGCISTAVITSRKPATVARRRAQGAIRTMSNVVTINDKVNGSAAKPAISDVVTWTEAQISKGDMGAEGGRLRITSLNAMAEMVAPDEPNDAVAVMENMDRHRERWARKHPDMKSDTAQT